MLWQISLYFNDNPVFKIAKLLSELEKQWISEFKIDGISAEARKIKLGNYEVTAIIYTREGETGKGGITMVNMHQDEKTSVHAAMKILKERGGVIIQFRSGDGTKRRVFDMEGKKSIDLNRIFDNPALSKPIIGLINEFNPINKTKPKAIIALHNTGRYDGIKDYENYKSSVYPHGKKDEVESIHVNPNEPKEDFFFVSPNSIQKSLDSTFVYNYALQKQDIRKLAIKKRGYLSVYCAQNGIPFINVESQHDKEFEPIIKPVLQEGEEPIKYFPNVLEKQVQMLRAAYDILENFIH